MTTHDFILIVDKAISSKNTKLLGEAITRYGEFCFQEPSDIVADDEFVNYLNKTIRSANFHSLTGFWNLMILIEYNWATFTEVQLASLLESIEFAFGKFADPMAWFLLSEILGEYYASEPALEVLERLSSLRDEGPRSMVPHGLEHIAKSTSDSKLKARAINLIVKMKHDKSETVREEAILSIERLRFHRLF